MLSLIGAGIFAILGLLHLVYTIRDWRGVPRYFRPADPDLLARMKATHTNISAKSRDYWSGLLGFHVSHSMAAIMLALLIVVAGKYDIYWLQALTVVFGAIFVFLAWRCWFAIPMIGAAMATVLTGICWLI